MSPAARWFHEYDASLKVQDVGAAAWRLLFAMFLRSQSAALFFKKGTWVRLLV